MGEEMFRNLLGKLWNRRKEQDRISLKLPVKSVDAEGTEHDLRSEDVSESSVRLWFEQANLGSFVGHREEIPLEIFLSQNGDAVRVYARLIWAYNTSSVATMSGWKFGQFEDDGLVKLRNHLDENLSLQ